MGSTLAAAIVIGLALLIVFVSGFRLRGLGKPYGPILLNIHKLIALAAGVVLAVTAFRDHEVAAQGGNLIVATIVTLVLFVITIITGGLRSIDRPMPGIVPWTHRIAPYLTVASTAGTIWLLWG